uniref:Grass induced protein n=1 Tax=Rhabditophanes sp. KR3021 TaxID=114890 RepID=A0AC35U4U2_9BILA
MLSKLLNLLLLIAGFVVAESVVGFDAGAVLTVELAGVSIAEVAGVSIVEVADVLSAELVGASNAEFVAPLVVEGSIADFERHDVEGKNFVAGDEVAVVPNFEMVDVAGEMNAVEPAAADLAEIGVGAD